MSVPEFTPDSQNSVRDLLGDYSSGGEGFVQQTFLGASIRDFNLSAGFGDSTSTLSVNLINDEFNTGDGKGIGLGHDVYHNGIKDNFAPPAMGSPVFFQFGKSRATVDEAYRNALDLAYDFETSSGIDNAGHFHLTFGGILQAMNEKKDNQGNPLYSVNVVDPREILSNVQVVLNNYGGTTYNNANLYNVFGFLESDLPENLTKDGLKVVIGGRETSLRIKDELLKTEKEDGSFEYSGTDMWLEKRKEDIVDALILDPDLIIEQEDVIETYADSLGFNPAPSFPITGTSFSRRSDQGIPLYRVIQGMNALLGIYGELPDVYKQSGFGGYINFRGFNYVVDLSGLPTVDQFYFLDYDKISLLDLCLEICEITNHELLVTLLPITTHPAVKNLKLHNDVQIQTNSMQDIVAGVIRIETIDRSKPQPSNSIKNYLDNLNLEVTNKNLGTELSNVNTDKFLVGANEVEMYYFSSNADRRDDETRTQWKLQHSFSQQILPYYGKLPGTKDFPNIVTIPKGYGAYQQILLDTSSLNAIGVGNFYVATELELRCAAVSFKRWTQFLLDYDSVYMESVEENDLEEGVGLRETPEDGPFAGEENPNISNNYAVTVPRSVWPSDENGYDSAGYPLSACNPPYGYPLYYQRATQIGIPTEGQISTDKALTEIIKLGIPQKTEGTGEGNDSGDSNESAGAIGGGFNQFQQFLMADPFGVDNLYPPQSSVELGPLAKDIFQDLQDRLRAKKKQMLFLQAAKRNINKNVKILEAFLDKFSEKNVKNAKKVYDFVKSVADECLGKKFLVKIPRETNMFYEKEITIDAFGNIITGPFGFQPRRLSTDPSGVVTFIERLSKLEDGQGLALRTFLRKDDSLFEPEDNFVGALQVGLNPIQGRYEFNYKPDNNGGFWEYDLLSNFDPSVNKPLSVSQALAPQDATVFDKGNNRISAYARFDNSQDLSFAGFSKGDVTQQVNQAGYFTPDLSYTLDNLTIGKPKNLPPPDFPKPKQVTFVSVDVEEDFYMAPQTSGYKLSVHGRQIEKTFVIPEPLQVQSATGCHYVDSMSYSRMVAVPLPTLEGQGYITDIEHFQSENSGPNGDILRSFNQHRYKPNTDHVYALITLPSKVVPTVDSRLRDGPMQQVEGVALKHILRQDVVRGVDGFDQPNLAGTPTDLIGDFFLQPLGNDAEAAIDKAREMATFGLPQEMSFTSPSPVYPDMVALPLMSKERCYGPWLSSQIGEYSNIGGRIEYIKDENLAPWNFSGYDLMNKSALVQATFSNSLLLASERGSFSIPSAPSGISIGQFLQSSGPLVTDISVSVGAGGVTTDYKLSLYTASFGKLQKQRQDNISKIARNQQKIDDERNALIRKGFGKSQTDVSIAKVYNQAASLIRDLEMYSATLLQKGEASYPTATVISTQDALREEKQNTSTSSNLTAKRYKAGSMQDAEALKESVAIQQDVGQRNKSYYNTASRGVTEGHQPVSLEPRSAGDMPEMEQNRQIARQDIYTQEDGIAGDQISSWSPSRIQTDEE